MSIGAVSTGVSSGAIGCDVGHGIHPDETDVDDVIAGCVVAIVAVTAGLSGARGGGAGGGCVIDPG
jgi:hypothetical protein